MSKAIIHRQTKASKILAKEYLVHLKKDVLIQNGAGRFNESVCWNNVRAALDSSYPGMPDVMAGFYILVESGNGGREMAIRNHDGREFLVHQDHAEILNV